MSTAIEIIEALREKGGPISGELTDPKSYTIAPVIKYANHAA